MLHCNIASRANQGRCLPFSAFCTFNFWRLTMNMNTNLTAEQLMAAHKANIETLFGLTNKAFESVEKLVELNMAASRAALNEAAAHTQSAFAAKDAQELLALQAGLLQPLAEKAASYSRHVYDIATGTGTEITKAMEEKAAEAQRNFASMVETASKNAPAGSENAVAVMKNAVSAANTAFESVQKAVKQATDAAETNFNAVAASTTEAVNSTMARNTKR